MCIFFNKTSIQSLVSLVVIYTSILIISPVSAKAPKLILQVTVDQLRGDIPFRYRHHFQKKGFNYLLDNGLVYRNAHHGHANTETIVGHVSLATGTYPANHGLVGNIWYDRKTGVATYNIESSQYHLLSEGADVDKSTEIDPTQKVANVEGRSPNNIMASTFSDEMIIASNGQAKVFGVSVKDRGAVSLAGHGGKAFWFSKAKGEFVTSSYYYQQYPDWVVQWNQKKYPLKFANKSWQLSKKQDDYLFGDSDDNKWEFNLGNYGVTFPHKFGDANSKYFTTLLTVSPVGDEMTVDFAKSLIINEGIGKDDITDYLSISLSSTDYIGHFFGASSLESEDNMIRLDNTIADLLAFIDKQIGLENTIIALSSDHGGPEAPGYLEQHKIQGKYVSPEQWDTLESIQTVKTKLNIKGKLITGLFHPYIYLNHDLIHKQGLSLENVQKHVAEALLTLPDVYQAIASYRVEQGTLADNDLNRRVTNNYFPNRSGDIYLVFQPQDFINDLDGLEVTVTHGSPWVYDTFVPLVIVGNGIKKKQVFRQVETVDLAPTLSALLQIKAPSASSGTILVEALE